ncbi:MAG TPA: helix-turn-helix domain-containing protein [Caulobacteraceae bacterium]|jgi:transposase-like protein
MSKERLRTFSRAFKLKAIERMDAGDNVSALSRELEVKREILYRWRSQYRSGGEERLRERRGRPTVAEALVIAAARGPASEAADLAAARRQVAELERKVGQQQLDLDFFKGALRHIEASRRPSDRPGATASSSRSRR